ncbi:MAG: hypothetical protein RL377_1377, partial [Bacteroidota bacterium]
MANKGTDAKKLDILNLFYSLGAVVILIGVIAKLLEWEVQDIFMTVGLTMEAIVFGVSSVKFISKNQNEKSNDINNESQIQQETLKVASFETEKINDQLIHSYVLPQTIDVNNVNQSISFPQSDLSVHAEVKQPMEHFAPDLLWQLDKLGIISFPKDIFYQPEWASLNEDQYAMVTQIFLDLFGKKVVPQKNIALLKSYDIRLPESGIGELQIQNPVSITEEGLKALILAFKPYRYKGFFDLFILYTVEKNHFIRSVVNNEKQVFAGSSLPIQKYCQKFHSKELIVSPALDFLAPFIKLKNEILLDYIIKHFDKSNSEALDLMVQILFDKNDQTKLFFIDKFKSLEYHTENKDSLKQIQSIILLLASFSNKHVAKDVLRKILIIPLVNGKDFKLEEKLSLRVDTIRLGDNKVFAFIDLFDEHYIQNCKSMLLLQQSLIEQKFVDISILVDFFEADKEDSLNDVYMKYNNFINKYEITPNSTKIEFALLCKTILN